jgi:hypothetical protein
MNDPDGQANAEKRIRDWVIFTVATVGLVHEIFLAVEPRAALLFFFASVYGIPLLANYTGGGRGGRP